MRDFPSCFGENGVQIADASSPSVALSKSSQNSVTCLYKCELLGKLCLVTTVWSKNLMGQCLNVEINDASSHQCICKVDVKPSLFSRRKGSKSLSFNSSKIQVFWDLTRAKFGPGPEPLEGYYIAIVDKGEMVLVIGDLRKEAFKKAGAANSVCNAMLISKREHISGKRLHETRAKFWDSGRIHDLKIDCDDAHCIGDPSLVVWIDGELVMQVKHLRWKFRGNSTILVDGMPVEVYWDVHNWLFGSRLGYAVFVFRTSLSPEKMWIRPFSSFCDSWNGLESFKEPEFPGPAFALVLYAMKSE